MATLQDLANSIAELTGIATDAGDAQPGKPVHIDVLSGFNSALLAVASGPLGLLLKTLNVQPTLTVQFDIKKKQGMSFVPVNSTEVSSTPPVTLNTLQNEINVAFLLKPPIGEDTNATEPVHYQIDVTLSVAVTPPPPTTGTKIISVPLDMPAIQIPSLLLLGKHANFAAYDGDDAGSLFVMVRASSPLRDLGTLVTTLNRLIGLIQTLETVLHFGTGFIDTLGEAASFIGNTPTVYFNIGNCPAFDDGDKGLGFEHDATSLLLIGVRDGSQTVPAPNTDGNVPTVPRVTQVTLYSKNDFALTSLDPLHEADHTTFSLDEMVIPAHNGLGAINTGLGVLRIDNFTNPRLGYATESGNDMNDDTQSARWGGVDS